MRRYIVATILLLALTGTAHAATPGDPPASERRTALVIGNSDYKLISPLRNPVNDARAMARVLGDLGFEVIAKENLDQKEMKRAIRDFGRKLGQGGVGLFYYAGHGVEVDGVNYLVPLEAPITFEDDVEIEAVDVNMVLRKMASAANRLNIAILDACRNNPYARSFRSTARGLAQIDAPSGTLIAYAAKPGGVALDGEGENGLYTGALLDAMQLPGLRIEDVFKRVRVVVQEQSGMQQVPWESSSLTGDFYFNLNVSVTVEAPDALATTVQQEIVFWQSIENSTDPAMFDAYLQQFPDGTFAGVARLKRDALIEAEQEETQTAVVVPPPELSILVEEMDATFVALMTSNIRAQPKTKSDRIGQLTRDDAVAVTGKIKDKNWYRIDYKGRVAFVFGSLISRVDPGELAAWGRIAGSSEHAEFGTFLANFPDGHFAGRARAKLDAFTPPPSIPEPEQIDLDLAFWQSIKVSTNQTDFEAYLAQYPKGAFVVLARNRLKTFKETETASIVPVPSPAPRREAVQPAVGVYPETYQPGQTFKDCDECPEMVVVPAGSFMMGSPSREIGRDDDEGPQHEVTIRKPFAVGKYEVTFREWDACLADAGCGGYRPDNGGWGGGSLPVIFLRWNNAQDYTRWLSQKTGWEYRLLSEAEWEYAARAGTTTPYYWGEDVGWANANCADCGSRWGNKQTAPVGSFPANAFGLHDMAGNVSEWVEDCWNDSYDGAPSNGDAWTTGNCRKRVYRGASLYQEKKHARSANRRTSWLSNRYLTWGVRVARTLAKPEKVKKERDLSEQVKTALLIPPQQTGITITKEEEFLKDSEIETIKREIIKYYNKHKIVRKGSRSIAFVKSKMTFIIDFTVLSISKSVMIVDVKYKWIGGSVGGEAVDNGIATISIGRSSFRVVKLKMGGMTY